MEDEDIIKEIKKIELAADRLVQESHEKARELELSSRMEIKRIELEAEKEFETKASELKSALENKKKKEELQLAARFDEERRRLENLDIEIPGRLIDLVTKKICEG